ncbi:magnesium/cobalt transporter CorA [Glaciihabitans arcticus]|uniref:Magnesium transport protein CorA n=1 Tax=Glaciihabitans arcticus TaxID=2668039 RepID=A0A4Q9GXL7_9MICO|nr:magnesium/cobalt transporter CorA [Glaciihabitans arcticus]TBN58358.1 magnesium/cobalt transporter CorA [Glaciihabitans arcticus]
MALIDNGIYVQGKRTGNPDTLDETYELMRERDGMAWIGLYRPDPEEIRSVATEFSLHPLAVEDALKGHQRAKLERYGDTLFIVLRPARYLDAEESVEFGEVHLFIGPGFVVTIRHAENPDLKSIRKRLEAEPELLCLGPEAVLYAVLDDVVDGYIPVIAGLENDIDEIQDQLFGNDTQVSRRIFQLLREVIAFQRAAAPLRDMLESLQRGSDKYKVDIELQRSLRDILDHAVRITERTHSFRSLLENALTVHSTLVSQKQNEETRRMSEAALAQNEEVKKISSWAAILFAPALIGTIYGMNFTFMPELDWPLGYPIALAAMFVSGFILWRVFKKRRWL